MDIGSNQLTVLYRVAAVPVDEQVRYCILQDK